MASEQAVAQALVAKALAPGTIDRVKADPAAELPKLAQEVVQQLRPLETDVWIYRIVVGALGLAVLASIVGAIVITLATKQVTPVPDILTAIGSAAVGALAGLLAPSPVQARSPQ